jgi:cytochrome bd-type quinol oxidase subunit 2
MNGTAVSCIAGLALAEIPAAWWLAGVILVSLTIYALGAGADFGGGVWDLFATGARRGAQRHTIARAMGPIWEANHVWLILAVVLLFAGFPVAFAALGTALHIPLSLLLIGIVLRGSAFTFRTYDDPARTAQRRWGRLFAIASLVPPVMLGVCVGAVASGSMRVRDGRVVTDFVSQWLAPGCLLTPGGYAIYVNSTTFGTGPWRLQAVSRATGQKRGTKKRGHHRLNRQQKAFDFFTRTA